jgi:ribosome maturation factor RimP
MGELIEVRLYKAENGSKFFTGRLAGYEDGRITLDLGKGQIMTFEPGNVSRANLAVVF